LLGFHDKNSIAEFMKLLARKNRPKGHERCPCGSGKRLRNCHRQLLYNIREKVAWEHFAKDLQTVSKNDKAKQLYKLGHRQKARN
jgi:hypothetical protein